MTRFESGQYVTVLPVFVRTCVWLSAAPHFTSTPAPSAEDVYRIDPSGRPLIAPIHERLADLLRLALGALAYRATGAAPRLFARSDKQALFAAFATADMVLACGGGYFYDTVTPTGRLARLVSFFSWSGFVEGITP